MSMVKRTVWTMDLPLRLDREVHLLVLETGTSTTVFTGEENGPTDSLDHGICLCATMEK